MCFVHRSDDQWDTTWGSGMIVGLMMETWMSCIYLRRERVLSGAFVNILSVVVEPKMTIFNVSTHFPSLSFLLWSSSVNVPSWIKMMEKQILKKKFLFESSEGWMWSRALWSPCSTANYLILTPTEHLLHRQKKKVEIKSRETHWHTHTHN